MMPAGVAGNGAYVDEVFLFGDGPGNSADTEVLGETIGLVPISAPISMDGITYYASPDHFLASLGTLTVYAQTSYTDNTGTYQFRQWSNGVTSTSTSVTVAFDGGGTLYAEYSYVSDFTITPSNIYFQVIHGDSDQQLVLTLTSRNGFAGSIALTSSASPSGLSYSLSNNSVVLASGGTSTVTITVNSSSSVGTYTLVVTGTGNSIVRTATFTVGIVTSGGDGCSPIHGASRMSPDTLRC